MGKHSDSKDWEWEEALKGLSSDAGALEASRQLRRTLPAEVARFALQQRELRQRAVGRIERADRLCLTSKGLEQATRSVVAHARARRIADRIPGALVFDATSGLGSDSLALASKKLRLLSGDLDPTHAQCVRKNLVRLGFRPHVVVSDAARPPIAADVLVIDPDRRQSNQRKLNPEDWSPKLSRCIELATRVRGGCFKLAPALDVESIRTIPADLKISWQWTSVGGELVEVTLWTGELAEPSGKREIQCFRSDGSCADYAGFASEDFHLSREAALDLDWISEPDPALIRSGLLTSFARERDLGPVGPSIAYLGSTAQPAPHAFLKTWRVLASEAVDRRRIRALLRQHDLGELVVKKRGHPRSAAELAREFKGKGSRRGTLIVTRLESGHRAYLVEPAVV